MAAPRVYRVAIILSRVRRVKKFAYKTSNLLGYHGMRGWRGEGRGGGGVITPALKGNGIMRSPCVRFTSLYRLSGICFDYTVETHGNFGVAILIIEDNG